MPGFVDTHIHAPQYKFTGTGYDLQLLEWLDKYTFPTEAKFSDVRLASKVYQSVVVRLKSSYDASIIIIHVSYRNEQLIMVQLQLATLQLFMSRLPLSCAKS